MSHLPANDKLDFVREGYDRWASVYDHDANPLPALEEPYVREAAGEVRGLDVLDLGCGTGRHTMWLAAGGARVTALDFSEGMLEKARAKAANEGVRFIVHDLHSPLPLADASFDLLISGLVLEHLREVSGVCREAHRVLRQGGAAVLSAMHPAMFLRGSQARFTDRASGQVVQPGSVKHQLSDFVMAAVRAGFHLENMAEYAPDAAFASRYPRAEKYIAWPMLVILKLRRSHYHV